MPFGERRLRDANDKTSHNQIPESMLENIGNFLDSVKEKAVESAARKPSCEQLLEHYRNKLVYL